MHMAELRWKRLAIQGLAQPLTDDPADVVRRMGAVQSQDYGGAKWALGMRTRNSSDASIEQALSDGLILRTHVMRPTWHFVIPDDIRWMLELTSPRVKALMSYYNRVLELDDAVLARSSALIVRALEGGHELTRPELADALSRGGIDTHDMQRVGNLMMWAELEGLVCSGARRGKQATYALLDERAPRGKVLAHDEALAALACRYFTSHGPATLKDYVWWSGLTVAEAKTGLDSIRQRLREEIIDGQSYWLAESAPEIPLRQPSVYLLPNFDEYTVGYTDRSAIFDWSLMDRLQMRDQSLLDYAVIIDGEIVGTWKRKARKRDLSVAFSLVRSLTDAETTALDGAMHRYGDFVGLAARADEF